jgi:GNAT superfamily N-acetyltransferase
VGEIGPRLRAPERLTGRHDLSRFDCGDAGLNDWLKRRALKNEGESSRTYVVCAGDAVVGFYCLAAGAVIRAEAPKPLQRNMPEQVPVILIGRLAVDAAHQGQGIGAGLLKDALLRAIAIAEAIGVRAILVHALNGKAAAFYARYGFQPSPIDPQTLLLPMETAVAALG